MPGKEEKSNKGSGKCPTGNHRAASGQMENNFENLNNVQALRAQANVLQREQAALIQSLSRQDRAKRRAKKRERKRRESVPIQQGERRIILMRPGRRTEPPLLKSVLHNLWKKRIVKEPVWPSRIMELLPRERKLAAAYLKRKQAEERAKQEAEQQQLLQNAMQETEQEQLIQSEIPSELLESASAPDVCPAPQRGRAPRLTGRPSLGGAARSPSPAPHPRQVLRITGRPSLGAAARSPSPAPQPRQVLRITGRPPLSAISKGPTARRPSGGAVPKRQSQSGTTQGLKEEEQILKKLTAKQRQVVDIEWQKLKQEESALLRNLHIQRQEAARARRKKEEERRRPQDKRRMHRESTNIKRKRVQEQKCTQEKAQEQRLTKERAQVQRYEKDWLKFEEQELQQRQRLLDERASQIANMLQNETAEIQSEWQNLQQELEEEREKLRRDREYLEGIRAEQDELEIFEKNEREMIELQEFEDLEKEIEEEEAAEEQTRLPTFDPSAPVDLTANYRPRLPTFDPSAPVDLTANYRPLPPADFMPSDADTDESFCIYPGL